jgi:hypothetical protein
MLSSQRDDWRVARARRPNVAGMPLDYLESPRNMEDEPTPLWKDLTIASGIALALWGVAALIFLG